MIRRFAFVLAAAALSFTGCEKVKSLNPFKKKAAATPAPVVANATPAPITPQPVPQAPQVGEQNKTASASAPAAAPAAGQDAEAAENAAALAEAAKSQVVVLCYHRLEGKAGGALSIEPEVFEQQMQRIKDEGLTAISMQDFLAWRKGEKAIPPKCVLITLDDGYVSSYEVGVPILKKFGYPATFYVYLEYINKGGKSITWEQLADLRDQGFDIGSHTVSHLDLRRKPSKAKTDYDTWLKDEVERSKQELEQQLGIKVLSIAYPFGLHNEKVHEAVKAAGYELAFSTYGQRLGVSAPAYKLGRYDVTTKDAQGRGSFDVAISFEGMVAPGGSGEDVLGQDAAVSMITAPGNNDTINNAQPDIKANLATMGAFDAKTVEMRISGLGLVPAKYDPASKSISYKVAAPLKPGQYTVIVSAKSGARRREARWSFNFDPQAQPSSGEDEALPPRPAGQKAR